MYRGSLSCAHGYSDAARGLEKGGGKSEPGESPVSNIIIILIKTGL